MNVVVHMEPSPSLGADDNDTNPPPPQPVEVEVVEQREGQISVEGGDGDYLAEDDDDEGDVSNGHDEESSATYSSFTSSCRGSQVGSNSTFCLGDEGTCMGWLQKYSLGKSFISIANWKRRYFVLASLGSVVSIGYYKDQTTRKQLGSLQLDRCSTRLVTRPSTLTHRQASMPGQDICIIYSDPKTYKELRLLLRADTREDHARWVDALTSYFHQVDLKRDFAV